MEGSLRTTLSSFNAFQSKEETALEEEAERAIEAAFIKWLEEDVVRGPCKGRVKAVGSRQLGLRLSGSDLGNAPSLHMTGVQSTLSLNFITRCNNSIL